MTDPGVNPLTEFLLAFANQMAQIIEALNGYRARLEAEGYPSAVVDMMVADYHRLLLEWLSPRNQRNQTT